MFKMLRPLKNNKKGFTLLEVLIVLVILAVLAGLAIPAYTTAVEKSRAQEALAGLTAVRASLTRHFAITGSYTNATFTVNQGINTLDYDPNIAVGGATPMFTYALGNLAAATYRVTATRVATANNPIVGGGGTIAIDQAGTITRTGIYQ